MQQNFEKSLGKGKAKATQSKSSSTHFDEEREFDALYNEEANFFYRIKTMQQKWHVKVNLKINKSFHQPFIALVDSGADLNCIQEGLIPTQYYQKTLQKLYTANNQKLQVNYKLEDASICNKGISFKSSFLLVKDTSEQIILGTLFLTQLYPLQITEE